MINIGIIGGGNISETHARAALETAGVKLAAVYGRNRDKVVRLSELYGGSVYESLPSFLKHKPLDMVMIGSPSGLHAEQGIAAARNGLHVLVEKPIDISAERTDALIKECEQAGVKLGVCFQDRVAPEIYALKQLIDAGGLGRPILVSGRVKWYRPPQYYSGSQWRGTTELDGGGALMNQGIHTVDLLLWLMGDVKRVQACAITALHDIAVEDTLVATLEFANGAVGTFEATTAAYPGFNRRVELSGSEGTVVIEQDRLVGVDLHQGGKDLVSQSTAADNMSANSPVVSDVSGHQRILADFVEAISLNRRPRCDGVEGRRSVELVQAMYESARTGRGVGI